MVHLLVEMVLNRLQNNFFVGDFFVEKLEN